MCAERIDPRAQYLLDAFVSASSSVTTHSVDPLTLSSVLTRDGHAPCANVQSEAKTAPPTIEDARITSP